MKQKLATPPSMLALFEFDTKYEEKQVWLNKNLLFGASVWTFLQCPK